MNSILTFVSLSVCLSIYLSSVFDMVVFILESLLPVHTSPEGGASFYKMSLRLLRWYFHEWPSPFRISKNRNRSLSRFSATGSDFCDAYFNPLPYGRLIPSVRWEGVKNTPQPKPHIETFLEAYFPYEPPLRVFRQFPDPPPVIFLQHSAPS